MSFHTYNADDFVGS